MTHLRRLFQEENTDDQNQSLITPTTLRQRMPTWLKAYVTLAATSALSLLTFMAVKTHRNLGRDDEYRATSTVVGFALLLQASTVAVCLGAIVCEYKSQNEEHQLNDRRHTF